MKQQALELSLFLRGFFKGQLILKAIFHGFSYFKKKKRKFFHFSALVSKMCQIKECMNDRGRP